ncbi:MAG: QueT transporter family protein [Clostridia bacterium]|nr:QueT transporter family protein [Clostridia bacterium]
MKNKKLMHLTLSAVIAALFAALTLLSSALGLAIGPFELRFSEALCILPVFTPAAIPGLFLGCILGNLLSGAVFLDVIFGSLATLIGALGTYFWRNKKILPYLPPILANTAIVPPLLYFVYGFRSSALPFLFFSIFVGEVISAGLFGAVLRKSLTPHKDKLK